MLTVVNGAYVVPEPFIPPSISQELTEQLAEIAQKFAEVCDLTDRVFDDPTTMEIKQWHELFTRAINRPGADLEEEIRQFTARLRDILVDPLSHTILDIRTLLGNDNHAYGYMTTKLHLASIAEELRTRSLLHPERPERFVMTPHKIVRAAIRWLQSRDAYHPAIQIEIAFQARESQLPPLPTETFYEERRVRHLKKKSDEIDNEIIELKKTIKRLTKESANAIAQMQGNTQFDLDPDFELGLEQVIRIIEMEQMRRREPEIPKLMLHEALELAIQSVKSVSSATEDADSVLM